MKLLRVLAVLLFAAVASTGVEVAAGATTPQTSITSGPSGLIAKRSATFRFTSNLQNATFQCRLDGTDWSRCQSPEEYLKLRQGAHVFRVRAKKDGAADPTPAVRRFTVDTVRPQSTIGNAVSRVYPGSGSYGQHFAASFSSSEAGTFLCRLDIDAFAPCTSTHVVPGSELTPDHIYHFAVRARDAAGNVDATPAVHTFGTIVRMPFDQATGDSVAAFHLPDQLVFDAPARCETTPELDCPGGQPQAPTDQVSVSSANSVVMASGVEQYDVTSTMSVSTVAPIKVSVSGNDCDLTIDSAQGSSATWTVTYRLAVRARTTGYLDAPVGERFSQVANVSASGLESQDKQVSGGPACSVPGYSVAQLQDDFAEMLSVHMAPACMAPGPTLLETCPWLEHNDV
jgi:hypothetical protein